MNNEHDIDKMLKESFDNFSPEAPNVWQAVQQGVQAAQASASVSSGVAGAAVQGVGLGVKIIAGIAIAAASITGYVLLNKESQKEIPQATHVEAQTEMAMQPEVSPEVKSTQTEESLQPEVARKITHQLKPEPKVAATEPSVSNEAVVQESSQPQETPAVARETKNETPVNTSDIVKETPVSVEPSKPVVETPGQKEQAKPAATKPAKTTGLPYNPYAQDGEVYEKPTIPGSFSPNNDGLNDRFVILIDNEVYFSLRILNDKGETVFESKSSAQTWDGKHYKTGVQCAGGTYIYVLSYQYKGAEKPHEESGYLKMF